MENEEEMLLAIDDYELYSLKHRELLKILITLATNEIASITMKYLSKALKRSLQLTYVIINKLEKDKFIERVHLEGTRHASFKINKDQIQKVIVELYKKKLSLITEKTK